MNPSVAQFSVETTAGGGQSTTSERYYQVEAVHNICVGLRDGGRGQLIMACGAGKTVTAQRAAELLCAEGGLVVILCPSIFLVAQTLREWAKTNTDHCSLAVCGDESVADAAITVDDVPGTVTTDPNAVIDWLDLPTDAGLRLIVGTHRSAHVIGDALLAAGAQTDVLIVDEAHRAAGAVDKHTALVHNDKRFPALRRLYATATRRIIGEKTTRSRSRGETRTDDKILIGMDDEQVFGPVLYEYPFSQAIEDGYLDDYRLVVMGVTRQEIREHLAGLPREATIGNSSTSLHTAMVQTVLAKAAVQYGMRRILAFCRRLNEAADFARTMNRTVASLPPDMRPARHLTATFVHGGLDTAERERRLGHLVDPPRDGWTVITNVRCLVEGVDVPAIDGVAFTHPKQSIIEIVQGIGRALRRDPNGTGTATILVPLLLPDDPDALDEIDLADYRLLWQVVRALRAHDDKLGADIDRSEHTGRRYTYDEQPLEQIRVTLPPGYDDGTFLHHLTAQMISSARNPWWDGYAALRQFHAEFGHTTFAKDFVTADGVALGAWGERTRTAHHQGRLSTDRTTALNEIGFDLLPGATEWAAGLRAATAYFAEHHHLEPVRSLRVLGVDLLAFLDKQRTRGAADELHASRRAALDALGMRWHDRLDTFDEYHSALAVYHSHHGHIDIAPDPDTPDGRLGSWLVTVRIQRKRRHLSMDQIARLDELGMRWKPHPLSPATPQVAATAP